MKNRSNNASWILARPCLAAGAFALVGSLSLATASEANEGDVDQLDKVPTVYVIPMTGQMGTDIHPSIYEDIIKDVEKQNPDIVIYRLKAADIDQNYYMNYEDRNERGLLLMAEYRDMVDSLHENIDAEQVMWVEDAVGISTLFAMAWPNMYMGESARLWGLDTMSKVAGGWSDADVASKMLNAWVEYGNGFVLKGGNPPEIGWAMMRPEYQLSASFKGRDVTWDNDTQGHWVIDSSDERVARFDNSLAEDVGLSQGTATSLEDLVFLLGYREFEENKSGTEIYDKYVEDWRRAYERTEEWMKDSQQKRNWATGEDTVKYLGAVKNDLERIVRAMRAYPAVEARWQNDHGVSRMQLEIEIEQLKEQIAGMRNRGGRGGGRGGSGRGSGRGGGGFGPGG